MWRFQGKFEGKYSIKWFWGSIQTTLDACTIWHDATWHGAAWHGATWHYATWHDVTWQCDAMWRFQGKFEGKYSIKWFCGSIQTTLDVCIIWHDATWRVMTWNDATWHEMTRHDMKWRNMTWNDATWHDTKWRDITWRNKGSLKNSISQTRPPRRAGFLELHIKCARIIA